MFCEKSPRRDLEDEPALLPQGLCKSNEPRMSDDAIRFRRKEEAGKGKG